MAISCSLCEKIFSSKSSLNRHQREVHKLKISRSTTSNVSNFCCSEDDCKMFFINSAALREHLHLMHNIETSDMLEKEFSSLEEFKRWFNEEQKNTTTSYYLKTRVPTHQNMKTYYYYCNRSGKKSLQSETSRKRALKSQGSCKIDKFCTSQLIVQQNIQTNKCDVRYFYQHYGHEVEAQHVRIPRIDRELIASKLISGVSVDNVLDSARNEVGIHTQLNRTNLLVRKDINNIKRAYHINVNDGCRHEDDATSVQIFVNECGNNATNPVIFYNFQGDLVSGFNLEKDFCLILMTEFQVDLLKSFGKNIICIDGTHGLNAYGFDLITLIVLDEYGEGFPVACMYTNRKDTFIYEVFFDKIKEKVGQITTQTFMSDIAPAFYNAWYKVMGPVQHRLLCTWHVDRCWKTHLSTISNPDQRQMVYKTLKHVQYISDENEFEVELENFLRLLNDTALLEFKLYFHNNYVSVKKQWAYAYRKQCGINTNMDLKSMHRTIKYCYFDGKKIKRLDKSIQTLLKFIRNKTIERLINITEGKTTSHVTAIHARHQAAACVSNYALESDSGNGAVIRNSHTNELFTIKVRRGKACCRLKCSFCQICIHSCSCTCLDFMIGPTLCKHIHFYIIESESSTIINAPDQNLNTEHDENNDENIENLMESIDNENMSKLKEEIVTNALEIVAKLQNDDYSFEQVNLISEHLKIANSLDSLPTIEDGTSRQAFKQIEDTLLEPSNKNIRKQISLFSTEMRSEKTLRKPDYNEKLVIKGIMNDHTY